MAGVPHRAPLPIVGDDCIDSHGFDTRWLNLLTGRPKMILRRCGAAIALLIACIGATPAKAATYLVITGADSGTGSLRWAIEQANATQIFSGPAHRIDFHPDVSTVTLTGSLPPIRRTTYINTDSVRRITITSSVPVPGAALTLDRLPLPATATAVGSIVDQIDILCTQPDPCFDSGIRVNRDAHDVLLDRVRVDRVNGTGLWISSSRVMIDRSEVTRAGLDESFGAGDRVGILCQWQPSTGAANKCDELTVVRSHIGVRPSGVQWGNAIAGIGLYGSSTPGSGSNHQIGGVRGIDGNVIGANGKYGIVLAGTYGVNIQGNYIGIRPDGALVPNGSPAITGDAGIRADFGSRSLLIGGDVDGLGNVVTGNAYANILLSNVLRSETGQPRTRIWRNRIGTTASGAAPGFVGGAQAGIRLENNMPDVHIGGQGRGNTIAHNPQFGVRLVRSANHDSAVTILGNSIHDNGPVAETGRGIQMSSGIYTQPAPVISNVTITGLTGSVAMPATGTVRIEVFVDDRDQGATLLQAFNAPASGDISQNIVLAAHNGRQLTATATWTDPVTGDQYSSRFSNAFPIGQMTLYQHLGGSGLGQVGSNPAGIACGNGGRNCESVFSYNTQVALTATPMAGSYFAGWQGGGCTGNQPLCTVTMNQSRMVTAHFQLVPPVQYNINAGVLGTGGAAGRITSNPVGIDCTSSSCVVPFPQGTELTLMVTPNANSYLHSWTGGQCAGTVGPVCTFIVTGASVERAVVALQRVGIDAQVNGRGHIQSTPAGITCGPQTSTGCSFHSFVIGTPVTLQPVPAPGETFLGWQDPTCAAAGTSPCVLPMQGNHHVHALFSDGDSIFRDGFDEDAP